MTSFISLILIASSFAVIACGPSKGKKTRRDSSAVQREKVSISVGVEQSTLGLAGASTFSMTMEGCASGLTYPTITQARTLVEVYKADQNCLIKLTSFSFGGIDYTPTADDPFTSWTAGDVAAFANAANPAQSVRVVVNSQLANPVAGTESVSYSFSQIAASSESTLAKSAVSGSHALSVAGQDATPLTIAGINFLGIGAVGKGQFVFTVECDEESTGTAPALSCGGTALDAMKYKLVPDTFSGTLTLAQAAALFDGSELAIADTEKLSPGSGSAPKGGFLTKNLTGPAQMHLNPNMLFVIQMGGVSYRYFKVDVSTIAVL